MLRLAFEHVLWEAQAFLQRVLDVLGEDAVDRIGLMAGQAWEAVGLAVGFGEFLDRLDDAQEARVDGDAVVGGGFAVATNDSPACRGEPGGVAVLDCETASGARGQLDQIACFAEEIELEGQEGFLASGCC